MVDRVIFLRAIQTNTIFEEKKQTLVTVTVAAKSGYSKLHVLEGNLDKNFGTIPYFYLQMAILNATQGVRPYNCSLSF